MMQVRPVLGALLPLLCAGGAAAAPPAAPAQPAAPDPATQLVNKPAPAFTLPDQNDKPRSLSANKNQWVVLAFFPKDMTKG